MEIKKQATNTTYIVYDGTGKFEARHWHEQNSEDNEGAWNGIEYVIRSLSSHCPSHQAVGRAHLFV